MRKTLAFSLLFLTACATSNAKVNITPPDVVMVQTSSVAQAARGITGPITVQYKVRVANRAGEAITLKRIDASTVGEGAYTIRSLSRPFNVTINPETYSDVDIMAAAVIESATVVGANGPVTVRLILHFDSPVGSFENVTIQQVNADTGVSGVKPQ